MFNVGDRVKLTSSATGYIDEPDNGLDVGSLGTVTEQIDPYGRPYGPYGQTDGIYWLVQFDSGYFGRHDHSVCIFKDEIELVKETVQDDIIKLLKLAQAAIIHYSQDPDASRYPDETIALRIEKFLASNT